MRTLCVFLSCPLRDGHGQVGGMKEGNRATQQAKLPLEGALGPQFHDNTGFTIIVFHLHDNEKSDFHPLCFSYVLSVFGWSWRMQ